MDFFLNKFVNVFAFLEKLLFLEPISFAMLFRSANTTLCRIRLHSGNKIIFNLINVKPHVLSESLICVLKEELYSLFEGLFVEVFPPREINKLRVSHSVLIG